MSVVPVIDLSDWFSGVAGQKSELAQRWDAAFQEYGCVIIVNHRIPYGLFQQIQEQSKDFFARPKSEKLLYNYGKYGNRNGGFTPVGNESVARSNAGEANKPPDLVENFVLLRNTALFSGEIPCPIPLCREYYNQMEHLLTTLHEISTTALRIDCETGNYFDPFYFPSTGNIKGHLENSNTVRLAHYPPMDEILCSADHSGPPTDSTPIRYGAHTDYLGYTILYPDVTDWTETGAGGLEIELSSGDWVPVKLPAEIQHMHPLIINAGDLFQMWTNDRWKAVNHRVANPRLGSPASSLGRYSTIFFSGPMNDALVECLPVPNEEGGNQKYTPVIAGEYLMMKLDRTIF